MLLWVGLFFLSMIAAVVTTFVLEMVRRPLTISGSELRSGEEVNFREIVSSLRYENFKWFLGIFVVLALGRMFVSLFSRSRAESDRNRSSI